MSSRAKLGLTLALGGLVIVLDTTITVVAIPVLAEEFDASLAVLQWTTTAYLLALVTTLPMAAWLASRFGAGRTYVAAMLVFAIGSLAAAFAWDPSSLIASRVLQGLGGGVVNPLGMAIAMTGLPADQRGRMAAYLGLPVLVGPLVGPLVAGALIDTVSWRAIFLITIPPALAAAWLVSRWAPPEQGANRIRLDVVGLALLVPGALATIHAVSDDTANGPVRVAVAVAGAATVGAFVARSLRHPAPLLRVRLLTDPVFASGLMVLVLFGAAYFGSMLLLPTYVQVTRDDTAFIAGLLGVPGGLAAGLGIQVATRLVDRLPPRRVVTTGLALAAAATAGGIAVLRTDTPYVVLAGLGVLLGLGSGAVILPTMTAATRHLDGADLASAASIMGLLQQLASAFGTAGIAATFTALAPLDAPPGDLVRAQQLTQLLPLALILLALCVATTRLGRASSTTTTTREVPHVLASDRANLAERG